MANLFESVRPGDVITSDLMNLILAKLQDIDDRVTTLETVGPGADQSLIESFDPPAQQEVGKVLTIFGKFDFPLATNIVTVDGVPVSGFRPGSNNLQLIILVPAITIPAIGVKSVKIRVTNIEGQDERGYLVFKAGQSTVPNPDIQTIVNLEDTIGDLSTLQALKKAKITGTNFAANPLDNIIKFKVSIGSNTITYPRQGDPPLIIDTNPAQTNTTQIVVTVPDIQGIGINNPVPIVVEVGVGTAVPDSMATIVFHA